MPSLPNPPSLLGHLPQMSLLSVIDIVLVALLIYGFLVLIRGTRGQPMLVGVGILAAIFYGSRFAGLSTLNWLLGAILPYAMFAMIVIFQYEIRQGLVKLGRILSFNRSMGTAPDVYDDIVLAAARFAEERIGALIAIEREVGLRTYLESGVPLNALISYDLLVTIFQRVAPLHDGAAIIQGDRIAAAACFLPLSTKPALAKELGSRHRAGIGLTEETDAVVVIVSEETGWISLAHGGQLERQLSTAQLQQRLAQLVPRYVPSMNVSPESATPLAAAGERHHEGRV